MCSWTCQPDSPLLTRLGVSVKLQRTCPRIHTACLCISCLTSSASLSVVLFFRKCAWDYAPVSRHHGAIHNSKTTTRKHKVSTRTAWCTEHPQTASVYTLIPLVKCAAPQRICHGCESAAFSPAETRLPATQLLSACQSCQLCCLSRVFLFFIFFTLTRESPSVVPPSDVALETGQKNFFWGGSQVSQLIVRFYVRSHARLLTFLKAVVWLKV